MLTVRFVTGFNACNLNKIHAQISRKQILLQKSWDIYEETTNRNTGLCYSAQAIALRNRHSSSNSRRILCILASSLCIVSLQNEINRKAITVFYPTQEMQIWDDEMFLKMFRFRREQFTELLKAFRLGNKSILCGRKGREQYFPADVCLMVVLRRFAFPCRFVDLVNIFGLPTHRICDIFHSTIDLLYIRYAKKTQSIGNLERSLPSICKSFERFWRPRPPRTMI